MEKKEHAVGDTAIDTAISVSNTAESKGASAGGKKGNKKRKKKKKFKKERLGRAISVVGDNLIVRCDRRINVKRAMRAIVVIKGKKKVGKVHDIFGPVTQPYVSVKLFQISESRLMRALSSNLYYLVK